MSRELSLVLRDIEQQRRECVQRFVDFGLASDDPFRLDQSAKAHEVIVLVGEVGIGA